jgi:AraC-like DNA-binding protein
MEKIHTILDYIAMVELSFIVMLVYIIVLIKNAHKANRIFLLFLTSVSFPLFGSIFVRQFPSITGIFFCIAVALTSVSGALIYLYIASLSGRIERLGLRGHLLFIPSPVFFMLMFYFIQSTSSIIGRPVFSQQIAVTAVMGILVSTVYIIFSFINIRQYSARMENWFSDTEKVSIQWLKKITVLALILFLSWDISFGIELFGLVGRNPFVPIAYQTLILVIIFITAFHVMRQQYLFQENSDIGMALNSPDDDPEKEKIKYAKQSITVADQKRYLSVLQEYMEKEKPYLDADITIRSLSESVDIPIHHLSIVINSLCEKNFAMFINEYRIREALSVLSTNENKEANILSIAFHSGFNSKSSFNSAFKKITGKTPSEYRAISA